MTLKLPPLVVDLAKPDLDRILAQVRAGDDLVVLGRTYRLVPEERDLGDNPAPVDQGRHLVEVERGRWVDVDRIQSVSIEVWIRKEGDPGPQRGVSLFLEHGHVVEVMLEETTRERGGLGADRLDEIAVAWVRDRLGDRLVER